MATQRQMARTIARQFMDWKPPITCLHNWTRWYGLVFHWRTCRVCRWTEGVIS